MSAVFLCVTGKRVLLNEKAIQGVEGGGKAGVFVLINGKSGEK